MIWKQYQNELLVAFTFVLLLSGIGYKSMQVSHREESFASMQDSLLEFKELVVYKKRWVDKKTSSKLEKLHKIVVPSKLNWQKKAKKLHAVYSDLTAKELNQVITALLNLPVQIQTMELKSSKDTYKLEIKCKW